MVDALALLLADADRVGEPGALVFDMVTGNRYLGEVSGADADSPFVRVWPRDADGEASEVPVLLNRAHIVAVQWESHLLDWRELVR